MKAFRLPRYHTVVHVFLGPGRASRTMSKTTLLHRVPLPFLTTFYADLRLNISAPELMLQTAKARQTLTYPTPVILSDSTF